MGHLHTVVQQELQATGVPAGLVHRFDTVAADGPVQKTTQRRVMTMQFDCFRAVEVHRTRTPAGPPTSSPLARWVPKGGSYGYDVIVHVGCETFLRGRSLDSVAHEFPQIPFTSLYDLQHKFLFYFGHLHRQSAPALAAWFCQHGGSTWLIDATVEADTPMYFGIYAAQEHLLLDAHRIPSEHTDAISPCLTQSADRWGPPRRVMHDLSDAMAAACEQTLPDVPHHVCHFHFLRDIGEDLYGGPQVRLRERMRQLKLQARLKSQRSGVTDWLRDHLEHPLALAEVLLGQRADVSVTTAGHEVVIAYQQWLLDYARDGRRQGFPFDPYLLYLHRRVVRAAAAVEQLLGHARVQERAPQVLKNFASMLRQYLSDPQVREAACHFEAAYDLFHRLRTILRLEAQGDTPLRDRYLLDESEAARVRQSLASFRQECAQRRTEAADEASQKRYRIIGDHLDRYWGHLFASPDDPCRERTTNGLEAWWGASKRRCRQRHGRKKLTREFRSLPPEFLLIANLENPTYVNLVLDGDLNNLAEKLADAGRTAGPWTAWRAAQHPLNQGRLPTRLIRHEHFLAQLTAVYDAHCENHAA